jgi:hypothetical protein
MTTYATRTAPSLARHCTACDGAGTLVVSGRRVGCHDCACTGVADPEPADLAPLSYAPTCGTCGDAGVLDDLIPAEGGWVTRPCTDCAPLPVPTPLESGDYAPPLGDDELPF